MKKLFSVWLIVMLALLTAACGKVAETAETKKPAEAGKTDIDLTVLSSTMVYSEVYNMVSNPENYLGKTVKMSGSVATFDGEGRTYYACIIADATACCSQGIEFLLKDSYRPEDYPGVGETVTVTGVFDRYYEGEEVYYQLIDSVLG